MKITVHDSYIETTIEASADELRSSNSLADSFSNVFRRVLNSLGAGTAQAEPEDETEEQEED